MTKPADTATPHGGLWRPGLTPVALNLVVAVYLLASCNASYWGRLVEIFEGRLLAQVTFAGAVLALMMLVISALAVRWLQKPVLILMVIIAAVASFYTDRLGVLIDREMIQNAVTTTVNESKHLITPDLALHVALRAVPAVLFILWVRVRRRGLVGAGLVWAGMVAGSFAVMFGLLYTDVKGFSTVLRGRKDLVGSLQPLAPMAGALRYAKMQFKAADIVAAPLAATRSRGRGWRRWINRC
ncbi:MAG: DUF1705 domain-containing protein [Paracoccaceae bacterium]